MRPYTNETRSGYASWDKTDRGRYVGGRPGRNKVNRRRQRHGGRQECRAALMAAMAEARAPEGVRFIIPWPAEAIEDEWERSLFAGEWEPEEEVGPWWGDVEYISPLELEALEVEAWDHDFGPESVQPFQDWQEWLGSWEALPEFGGVA